MYLVQFCSGMRATNFTKSKAHQYLRSLVGHPNQKDKRGQVFYPYLPQEFMHKKPLEIFGSPWVHHGLPLQAPTVIPFSSSWMYADKTMRGLQLQYCIALTTTASMNVLHVFTTCSQHFIFADILDNYDLLSV